MITPYHRAIVVAVATYYALLRTDIQELCCPNDKDGRATRRRISQVLEMGLIGKCRMEVVNPADHEAPMPAYFPTLKGLEWLAADTGDESWLLKCCLPPSWTKLRHWNAIAKWHILLDKAAGLRTDASIGGWLNEWDRQRDPKGAKPDETYMLYTLVTEKPKVVCAPDAAFRLCVGPHAKTHYVEIDRETSGINQIAASKTPGYAALLAKQLHRRHFETTSDAFWVLSVSYTPGRRDLLKRALRGKPGCELWKFAAWSDLTPDNLLTGPVWHRCQGEPGPLVKTAGAPVSAGNPVSAGSPGVRPAVVPPG